VEERSEAAEAQVLAVIGTLWRDRGRRLAIQDITRESSTATVTKRTTGYAAMVGSLVRRRLGLKPSRSTGIFTLGRKMWRGLLRSTSATESSRFRKETVDKEAQDAAA